MYVRGKHIVPNLVHAHKSQTMR